MKGTRSPRLALFVLTFLGVAAISAAALTGAFSPEEPPAPAVQSAPAAGSSSSAGIALQGSGTGTGSSETTTAVSDQKSDAAGLVGVAAAGGGGSTGAAAVKPPKPPKPDAAKDPFLTVVDNGDGSYRLSWGNMVPAYRVYVDNVLVTTTNLTTYDYTPAGPGRYAVRVTDSKGISVTGEINEAGVLAEGANDFGQLNVSGWTGITDVATGYYHTVGLNSGGGVVATGSNTYGQCDTASWTGITDVEAGWNHTLGIRSDGTVAATGRNDYGQINVGTWTGIDKLAAGTSFTVGLKSDGTVVATGRNQYGQCNVSSWTGVVDIACGSVHTLGLKADGTLLYAGPSAVTGGMFNLGQDQVGGWSAVTAIGAGHTHSLGISGGNALVCGTNIDGALTGVSSWGSLAAIDGGLGNTVGLRTDGTAYVAGQWWDNPGSAYASYTQVPTWTGLDQVSAQGDFIVGLVR